MANNEHRKRKVSPPLPSDQREGLRKAAKVRSGETYCPVCEVTLWPGTIEQHYQQELAKLNTTSTSLAHSKKRRASSSAGATEGWSGKREKEGGRGGSREKKLFLRTQQVLESVRRRHIQRTNSSSIPSLSSAAGSSSRDTRTCPVCYCPLPLEESVAEAHVDECLGSAVRESDASSDSEVYEEYTWCNVTRVRATSMLTPEARANMFDGTIISKGDGTKGGGDEQEVDVEDDETALYGSPQFDEEDVKSSLQASELSMGGGDEGMNHIDEEGRVSMDDDEVMAEAGTGWSGEGDTVKCKPVHQEQQQCLICMDNYHKPLVSIKCWHVYCERCWLQALASKKLCPKCKDITSSCDLRKIFL